MLKDLIMKNRSYRRFIQEYKIDLELLREFVDHARISNSAANRQPLKYILSNDEKTNHKIFTTLSWAAALKDWPGPDEGERPSAYIVMLGDTDISSNYWSDPGIAGQSILLAAVEKGLGGCTFGAINRKKLKELFNIPDRYEVLYVFALGKPKEEVVLEDLTAEGNTNYWRDAKQIHHVPKRDLDVIIIS